MNTALYKRSRLMYICEAALEYLISILVAGTYLAMITKELGISDTLTGIISSFISLGCVFQLFAMLIRKGNTKKTVLFLSVLNQLLFMFLYIIPLMGGSQSMKTTLFIVVILLAYFCYNIAHPKKIDWFMSLVDYEKRGVFTAKKEMVSLIAGMIFSFIMGAVADHYKEIGEIRTAFIICAIVIFVLMILHTLTMVFTIEKQTDGVANTKKRNFLSVLQDKNILRITIVFILWHIASYCAIPYYGTYQIGELGFSQGFVAVLSVVYAVARVSFSFFWGRYADRRSFAKMLRLCFAVAALGFLINAFCIPENGKIIYTLYYICNAIAMGGINSALINLCYDYVEEEKRADALAISLAIAGVFGFFATLAVSPLVTCIQTNDNTIFGIHAYAQQVLSVIAFIMTVLTILYVSVFLVKLKKLSAEEN